MFETSNFVIPEVQKIQNVLEKLFSKIHVCWSWRRYSFKNAAVLGCIFFLEKTFFCIGTQSFLVWRSESHWLFFNQCYVLRRSLNKFSLKIHVKWSKGNWKKKLFEKSTFLSSGVLVKVSNKNSRTSLKILFFKNSRLLVLEHIFFRKCNVLLFTCIFS